MKIVPLQMEHVDRVCEITDQAKAQLAGLGLSQWQKGYPNRQIWESDVATGMGRAVVDDDGQVVAAYAFQTTPDASYFDIKGTWMTGITDPYASVHRVAVADGCKGQGIAKMIFAESFREAREQGFRSVRIDTHPGNEPMKRALAKSGFTQCGEITLVGGSEDGDLRIAFETML